MFAGVKPWAVAQGIRLNVWSADGRNIAVSPWDSSSDYDGTPASFRKVFGHFLNAEAGDLVEHRAIDISDGDGLQAMRILLSNPAWLPGGALDAELTYLKRLSRDGVQPIYDSDFAPLVRAIIAGRPQPVPPVQPPNPPPVAPPPAGPGLHPLSPASVRVEELRTLFSALFTRLPPGVLESAGRVIIPADAWQTSKALAVEALRFYRRLRAKLGDTREIPAEDR